MVTFRLVAPQRSEKLRVMVDVLTKKPTVEAVVAPVRRAVNMDV